MIEKREVCESQRSQMTQEYINLQRNGPSLSRSPVTNDGERMMMKEEKRRENGEEREKEKKEKRRRKRKGEEREEISFWYKEKYDDGCGEGKIWMCVFTLWMESQKERKEWCTDL